MLTITKEELQRLVKHRESYLKLVQDVIAFYNDNEITTPLIATGTPAELLSSEKCYHYDPSAQEFLLKISLTPPAQPNDVFVDHRLIHGPASSASFQSRHDSGFAGSSETLTNSDDASMTHASMPEQTNQIVSDTEYTPSSPCDSTISIDKPWTSYDDAIVWDDTQLSIKHVIAQAIEYQLKSQTVISRFEEMRQVLIQLPSVESNGLNPQIIRLRNLMNSVVGTHKYSSCITAATYFIFFQETIKTHALYPSLALAVLYRNVRGDVDNGLTIGYLISAFARGKRISEFCEKIGFKDQVEITAIPLLWARIYKTQRAVDEWSKAWIELNTNEIYACNFVGLPRSN